MPTEIQGIKFFTISEVAEALEITPQTVRAWVKRDKLKGEKVGAVILITEKSLIDFLQATN